MSLLLPIEDDDSSIASSNGCQAYRSIYFALPENHSTGKPSVEEIEQWKEIYHMSQEDLRDTNDRWEAEQI